MNSMLPRLVLTGLIGLSAAASAIVLAESRRNPVAAGRSREFQQMLGGLGFGPAIDLSRCTLAFDPRLGPVCESRLGPIPGGGFVCPHHASSVFDYSPVAAALPSWAEATPGR